MGEDSPTPGWAIRRLYAGPSVEIWEDIDAVVHIRRKGDFLLEDARKYAEVLEPYLSRDPLLVLADAREGGEESIEVRLTYYGMARKVRRARVAVLGEAYHRALLVAIHALAPQIEFEFFQEELEALEWLLAPPGKPAEGASRWRLARA